MLELKNIDKYYKVGDGFFRALKKVNLTFNKGEFVAILGPSGCGKTTTLNIIGGLDRYTKGDLIINGTSTENFRESEWDAYRNNSVGFVFQSYNLINHLSVLDNVELGMTLSGVGPSERREKALEVLKRVGLETQVNKKPTKLSGGEKQRVAIARALVNDPDIILADEPTGALDSKTADEILSLIQEISEDKLVIMVTHARKYADAYASRIVELLDGEVVNDSKPETTNKDTRGYNPRRTAMSFLTALKLSFNNLKTKKFRTTITALASSIGIIGVGLVLSISNGFSKQLEELESDQLVGLPILIAEQELQIGFDQAFEINQIDREPEENEIIVYDASEFVHENVMSPEFLTYLETMDEEAYSAIHYNYGYQPIILHQNNGTPTPIQNFELGLSSFITPEDELEKYYEVLAGNLPTEAHEVVLLVSDGNVIDIDVITALGLDPEEKIYFEDLLDMKLYVARNDDLYSETGGFFIQNFAGLQAVIDNGIELTIVGLVVPSDEVVNIGSSNGIRYLYDLEAELIGENINSDICVAQRDSDNSIFDMSEMTEEEKRGMLAFLGCNDTEPFLIQIYSQSIDDKATIKEHIDGWNDGKAAEDAIIETDLAEAIGDTLGVLITSISTVLSAFASISLVVSSTMIGIIIYISVLERTKEIGIIRSLGGRKKDISRVFNAESVIIGAFAGLLGVTLTWLLTFPINSIAGNIDESLSSVAQANPLHLLGLVGVSIVLTFIGGFIPSRLAARKNPVEALRVE